MKVTNNDKRYKEALDIFIDIEDFFISEFKLLYMTTFITPDNMDKILYELEEIFITHEEYEKCEVIKQWRVKLLKI